MTDLFFAFDHEHRIDDGELRGLLGGKGLSLARMTGMGLPVPPGFTIPTSACLSHLETGWTDDLTSAVRAGVDGIEQAVERRIGAPRAPLLLSVRSGSAVSMPGMLDTVLNVGMTEAVARGLAALTGDEAFAWDTYRRAIVSFSQVVLGADPDLISELEAEAGRSSTEESERKALAFGRAVADAGHSVPDDPSAQIRAAIQAVFTSWNSDRAIAYRRHEGIDEDLGTAATVQAMVFGNLGERSGTGVAFSRNPSTGERGLTGDFLARAQGEDVVAGTHRTLPLGELEARWPDVWAELVGVSDTLETAFADMVDLEFTVEDGRLWLLQTRTAKRSPAAVFRTAVEMANDEEFPVDRAEAVRRCAPLMDDPPHLVDGSEAGDPEDVIAVGVAASPGRAVGVVSLDPDDAVERDGRGERVILVRKETSPADIHGMAASVGLVTALGGMVSHAAVVARAWGLAAVVGCDGVTLDRDAFLVGDRRIEAGTVITVCGHTGEVLLGDRPSATRPLPEVETVMSWAREVTDEGAAARGGTDVDPDDCLRLFVLKGMGSAEGLAEPLAASEDAVAAVIDELESRGLITELNGGRYRATPEGTADVERLYAGEDGARAACDAVLEGAFHPPNMLLKEVVTAWQVRTVDGQQVPNDHSDDAYDAAVIKRLRSEVHAAVGPIIADLATRLPRLARYRERLEAALHRLGDGDGRYVAHPLLDSYHTVWFELHEELIKLAGRDRKSETEAGRA